MTQPYLPQILRGWLPPEQFFLQFECAISGQLRAALCCAESLTHHLQQHTEKLIRLRLESQVPIVRREGDSALWRGHRVLSVDGEFLARSAWLVVDQEVGLYAYSEIAVAELTAEARDAVVLGEEPLGSLFMEREGPVGRTELELAEATIPDLAVCLRHRPGQKYWCRRSLFQVNRMIRARIYEIFLPSLYKFLP
ncbi:MAG: hypothetical protein H7837_08870 [Magnetococcus sp. MYC-9]